MQSSPSCSSLVGESFANNLFPRLLPPPFLFTDNRHTHTYIEGCCDGLWQHSFSPHLFFFSTTSFCLVSFCSSLLLIYLRTALSLSHSLAQKQNHLYALSRLSVARVKEKSRMKEQELLHLPGQGHRPFTPSSSPATTCHCWACCSGQSNQPCQDH